MSFNATVYRVLIASPGDLQEERVVIENVVHAWNASHASAEGMVLLPVRWETHAVPEYGNRPQAILNRRLVVDCDLLIGAFWTRVGTPTGKFESGTVEEIAQITDAGKPALLFFSSQEIDPDRVDLDQLRRVRELRARFAKQALIESFSSPGDLENKLTRHLIEQARRLPYLKEPVLGYDGMDAQTLVDWLADADLDRDTLLRIRAYETGNLARYSVLKTVERLIASR